MPTITVICDLIIMVLTQNPHVTKDVHEKYNEHTSNLTLETKLHIKFTNIEIVLSDPTVTLDLCQKSCIELNLLISQSGCFGAVHRKSNPNVFLGIFPTG